MPNIALPIIIVEGNDVSVYSTKEAAELALEPWWIRRSEGVIFDSNGRRLTAIVVPVANDSSFTPLKPPPLEKVQINVTPSVDAANDLRRALVNNIRLRQRNIDLSSLEDESLASLILRVQKLENQ